MGLLIGARKSDLARLQAYQVGAQIKAKNPNLAIDYQFRASLGDINQSDPLWKMPEKGVFTEDFRKGLLEGQWDMVVHSWKDLPIESSPGTEIVATLPRADMRDLFLFKESHWERVKGKKELHILSSSPRRSYNLNFFFADYFPVPLKNTQFHNVRGNILTRIKKLFADDSVDGLILAKAAIDRLLSAEQAEFAEGQREIRELLKQCRWQVLPLSENPTAAAQGALAVEILSSRDDLKMVLKGINCENTWKAVLVERAILKSHGGGCHQKIGVSHLVRNFGEITYLRGETESKQVLSAEEFKTVSHSFQNPFFHDEAWFERETIPYDVPSGVNAHFIARSNALPADYTPAPGDIVWTAGLKTWKSLAKRGVWVHGTSDSLGEKETMGIEVLTEKLHWAKWSHNETPASQWAKAIPTYRLRAKETFPNLHQYAEFYWTSGSQFLQAIKIDPAVLNAKHFCGPGNTFTIISEQLKKHKISLLPTIVPSYSLWARMAKENPK